MSQSICVIEGCNKPIFVKKRGLCEEHYGRWKRYRDPLGGTPSRRADLPLAARFWARVDKGDDSGCWLWTAGIKPAGYGSFAPKYGVTINAHRFAYELLIGPIPKGLTLDHLCRVKRCVRPSHLEPVTLAENIRRNYGRG